MQATLDASALKPFTRALTCIARYGDELTLNAMADCLDLSTTNSSKSAYTRFKLDRAFFQKYSLEEGEDDNVTGQLLVKSLLSILKGRAVDKTVEKVELNIAEGNGEEDDGVESKLIVILHCKHGVIKTHRLLLSSVTTILSPGLPDAETESLITAGPRAIKDMVDHFPTARGSKSDSQLVWTFGKDEIEVKTLASSVDSKGKSDIGTTLAISTEEFDVYNLYAAPTVIAFHLGEFSATIAFTDSMAVTMDIHFTEPAAPLSIDVEGDGFTALFVISTSQVGTTQPEQVVLRAVRKRSREPEPDGSNEPRMRKSAKAVQQTPVPARQPSRSVSRSMPPETPTRRNNMDDMDDMVPPGSFPLYSQDRASMPPPLSLPPPPARFQPREPTPPRRQLPPSSPPPLDQEPLFFPSTSQQPRLSSQPSLADLGLEDLTAEDVDMFNNGEDNMDDELVADSRASPQSIMLMEEDETVEATQNIRSEDSVKPFQPLFDD
ncbi:hypothetical protein CYLTODRAFT_385147 [Cylindrobasidium torrendii FP15055 ss-10]|uniref:Rad9-domain-containing protein n=1 Tax=Cylindrobasidium torrendii FP15055 ss-10 TaxID=1314674 RepID=A0A0D7BV14_9AGAR|nr:hypothetical protein CYLTODRAFT_385147 [Cylindrobasidium torrendii FP15055 ss-10]